VDLEQFYEADPRRRHSEELEFGRDWNDASGRSEVSWVEATGEIYAMREPSGHMVEIDPIGDERVQGPEVSELVVEVLGVVAGRDAVTRVMSGWEDAMPGAEGIDWVRNRIANAASETNDPPAKPSDDMSSY
jgi:hypothetical protein